MRTYEVIEKVSKAIMEDGLGSNIIKGINWTRGR